MESNNNNNNDQQTLNISYKAKQLNWTKKMYLYNTIKKWKNHIININNNNYIQTNSNNNNSNVRTNSNNNSNVQTNPNTISNNNNNGNTLPVMNNNNSNKINNQIIEIFF